MSGERLIFVYNADAGIAAGLLDLVHKTLSPSTYPCSLCGVTYGPLGMKPEWRAWLRSLPYDSVFYHRSDFRAAYPGFVDQALPLIAIDAGGMLTGLLGAAVLARVADVATLISLLEAKLAPESNPVSLP